MFYFNSPQCILGFLSPEAVETQDVAYVDGSIGYSTEPLCICLVKQHWHIDLPLYSHNDGQFITGLRLDIKHQRISESLAVYSVNTVWFTSLPADLYLQCERVSVCLGNCLTSWIS